MSIDYRCVLFKSVLGSKKYFICRVVTTSIFLFFLTSFFYAPLLAQDISAIDLTNLGGSLSTSLEGRNALQLNAPNVTNTDRRNQQLSGFAPFHSSANKKTGLGPTFVNNSCGACHLNNGRGRVGLANARFRKNAMVVKLSLAKPDENGVFPDVPGVGEQLQDRAVSGKRVGKTRLRWKRIKGKYPDGSKFSLISPRLNVRLPGFKNRQLLKSLRMTPGLVGMGLLEAIPVSTILGFADPADANGDGISGRPNLVLNRVSVNFEVGRFGFKSAHPTLVQQTGIAAFLDIGLTNPIFNDSASPPEINTLNFDQLVVYQALAGVPLARQQTDPSVIAGKQLFQAAGCDSCHKFNIFTSDPNNTELDSQVIHPFSDLLLHDMGPGLADGRPEGQASGSEWRTTPLWGLGFMRTVSKVKQRFLHDGRARSIEEAILWHDGEARASRDAFMNFSSQQRKQLLFFLSSL